MGKEKDRVDIFNYEDKEIENFLYGENQLKYVTNVEAKYHTNKVTVFIDDPKHGKRKVEKEFKPFIHIKDLNSENISFYENNDKLKKQNLEKYGIKIKKLKTYKYEEKIYERLENGYKYLITSDYSMLAIQNFLKEGGINLNQLYNDKKKLLENDDYYYQQIIKFLNSNFNYISSDKKNNLLVNNKTIDYLNNNDFTKDCINEEINQINKGLEEKNKVIDEENELINKHNEEVKAKSKKKKLKNRYTLENLFDDESFEKLERKFNKRQDVIDKIAYKNKVFNAFFIQKPTEQFLISTGIRLFKGYEMYNQVHTLLFDFETESIDPETNRIFMIGMKDNKDFQKVLAVNDKNDEEEIKIIKEFFYILTDLQPPVIAGYNSENFDFNFILRRAEILNIDLEQIQTTYDKDKTIKRVNSTIKLGNETQRYVKTVIYGGNVIDVYHAVSKTAAINSDIQYKTLKYICKFEGIAKPDRMYVPGDKIYKYWKENKNFIINTENNEYKEIPDEFQNKPYDYLHNNNENYYNDIYSGSYIVEKYLLDDLWETEKVNELYYESDFAMTKLLPTIFHKEVTMGGANKWNLLMTAISYKYNIAIPKKTEKTEFVGGLTRCFYAGYFENVYKFDYSGLYPKNQLEHDVFPDIDVFGLTKRILAYTVITRDSYKYEAKVAKKENNLDLKNLLDVKQLPLKNFNNSNFGATGADVYNWAEFDKAERITCSNRLYLRSMGYFYMQFGCIPIMCDTDGINMSVPNTVKKDIYLNDLEEEIPIENLEYQLDNKTFYGIDAITKRFNEEILNSKYMLLDIDEFHDSQVTFMRKNYANYNYDSNKIKRTGATIKSRDMPEYIEDFITNGLELLLKNKPLEFVEYYYDYLGKIYTQQIPLKKIASKNQVKETIKDYKNRGTDKNGREKGKKAHMELCIQEGYNPDIGEQIYFVNNGTAKSHGESTIDNKTGKLRSYMITKEELESNPNKMGEYNVSKYIDKFNNAIKPLLKVFSDDIKERIIKNNPKDREYFTNDEVNMVNNVVDPIEEFFTMSEDEVDFWNRTGYNPYEIFTHFYLSKPLKYGEYYEKLEQVNYNLKEKNIKVYSFIDEVNINNYWLQPIEDENHNVYKFEIRKKKDKQNNYKLVKEIDSEYLYKKNT